MATVNVLIKFKGNAEEALSFYKDAFNGEFLALLRHGDDPVAAKSLNNESLRKISFIALDIGNHTTIMASDIIEPTEKEVKYGDNICVYINADNSLEVDSIFGLLSEGGAIEVKPSETPWGSYYCAFADKFGIPWMINYQRDLGPLSRRP